MRKLFAILPFAMLATHAAAHIDVHLHWNLGAQPMMPQPIYRPHHRGYPPYQPVMPAPVQPAFGYPQSCPRYVPSGQMMCDIYGRCGPRMVLVDPCRGQYVY